MTPFIPSTLPLVPLLPPQVLFPYLQVTVTLPASHLSVILQSVAKNATDQKVEEGANIVAVVPVVEIERRVGRWACGR